MFRELTEETGLPEESVELTYVSDNWYQYHLPKKNIRKTTNGITVVGQRQKWFLLKLKDETSNICLNASPKQEFDSWEWIDPEVSIKRVIGFKRKVYEQVIDEFKPFIQA